MVYDASRCGALSRILKCTGIEYTLVEVIGIRYTKRTRLRGLEPFCTHHVLPRGAVRDATESIFVRAYADEFADALKRGAIMADNKLAKCSLYPPCDDRIPPAQHRMYYPNVSEPPCDMVYCINGAFIDLMTQLNYKDMKRGAFVDQNMMVVITEEIDLTSLNHADLTDGAGQSTHPTTI